jgi:hypothetical protein
VRAWEPPGPSPGFGLAPSERAKQAWVSLRTVAAFERGEILPLPSNLSAMQAVFERAGLRLLFDRNGIAAGVARHAAEIDLRAAKFE